MKNGEKKEEEEEEQKLIEIDSDEMPQCKPISKVNRF